MGIFQMVMIGLAVSGIVGAVLLEIRRQRREGRQLQELQRRMVCHLH